jgi:hypothetical protein
MTLYQTAGRQSFTVGLMRNEGFEQGGDLLLLTAREA